jgi:hypothetical protein
VSALKKKYGVHEIGTRARDLVNKWKDIVTKEDNEYEPNSEENEEEDNDDSKPDGALNTDKACIPTPIAQSDTSIDELLTVAETFNTMMM